MPHFKCEMSVFMGQLWRRVRIAVRILCISWHMRHPPKAMKYITCRVMSFRPWQASSVPLRGLSRLHSPFSLTLDASPALSFHLLRRLMPHCCFAILHSFPVLFYSFHHYSYSPSFHYDRFPLSQYIFLLLVHAVICDQTSVAQSTAKRCSAMIQKPHINTGISPRDYLSVACLPGRVPCSNLCSPVNAVRLGKRGFRWVWGLIGFQNG